MKRSLVALPLLISLFLPFQKCRDDLKDIVGNISKLKYELQTDKPFKLLEDNWEDVKVWNDFIQSLDDNKNSYYSSVWLHAECYLYRRLKSFFLQSGTLRSFDYFGKQKQDSFTGSLPAFIQLATHMTEMRQLQSTDDVRMGFEKLVKVNLWGNRIDLSISAGVNVTQCLDPFTMIAPLEECILANDVDAIWEALSDNNNNSSTIDIIHDNAGYELFTDLVLIDFMLTHNIAERVNCHVKTIPWFVSDVTPEDFRWTMSQLNSSDNLELKGFGMRLGEYIQAGRLVCVANDYWTSPYDYVAMERVNAELYRGLRESKCLIFKGDLNYRKLMDDINWEPTTEFSTALRSFRPTNLCAFRTIKADTVSGLKEGAMEVLNEKDGKWMETGEYGLIQFAKG